MKVICNKVTKSCHKKCPHLKPHDPIKQYHYTGIMLGLCNTIKSYCKWFSEDSPSRQCCKVDTVD